MKNTSERHSPDSSRSPEEHAIGARHRYAYSLVEQYAEQESRLLDVGSGEGYGSTIVRGWVAEYWGVDVSAEAIGHARRRYGDAGVHFEKTEGGKLPFPNDQFDLITSFQVIEHVADVPSYLGEMLRVAKPGAAVLLTTPNRKTRLADGERPWNRYHLREYSSADLRAALDDVFSHVEILGVRGPAAMEALERKRIAHARLFAKLDPIGLRYRLPESADSRLRHVLRRATSSRSTATPRYAASDLRHTATDLDASLDLLAVARP